VPLTDDEVGARLIRELGSWRSGLRPYPADPASVGEEPRELVERLRALGYLD
jgi:hypothetical protein